MDIGKRKSLYRPTAPYRLTNDAAEKVSLIVKWKVMATRWYKLQESVFRNA